MGKGPVAGGSCLWEQKMVCVAGAQDTGMHAARAAVVRRYQMRRESLFCLQGTFTTTRWLAKNPAESQPARSKKCDALESDLRSYTGRMWKAGAHWLFCRVLCPASPLHPCSQSKLSLPRALPSDQGRDSRFHEAGRPSFSWHSPRGRPESAVHPASLRLHSPALYHETQAGLLWAQTSLVGKAFGMTWFGWTESNPAFNSVTPHFQMSAETQKMPLNNNFILSWEGFAHLFGNHGTFPYLYGFLKHNHSLFEMASPALKCLLIWEKAHLSFFFQKCSRTNSFPLNFSLPLSRKCDRIYLL